MIKGEQFGECASECCSTAGANSPDTDVRRSPMIYYCQDCAKMRNEVAISRGLLPPCVVRHNQFK